MGLDTRALDRWIEAIPEWEPVLISELNYADYQGKDLRVSERECERCAKPIGWNEELSLIPYWQIDEDGEREADDDIRTLGGGDEPDGIEEGEDREHHHRGGCGGEESGAESTGSCRHAEDNPPVGGREDDPEGERGQGEGTPVELKAVGSLVEKGERGQHATQTQRRGGHHEEPEPGVLVERNGGVGLGGLHGTSNGSDG